MSHFGVPDFLLTDFLLTDQGQNFESTLLRVSKTRTNPYHPQSDGLIKRFNHALLSLLSMATKDEHNWDLHLFIGVYAYSVR